MFTLSTWLLIVVFKNSFERGKKIIEAIVIEKCVLLINKLKFPPKSAIELKYCHLSFIN